MIIGPWNSTLHNLILKECFLFFNCILTNSEEAWVCVSWVHLCKHRRALCLSGPENRGWCVISTTTYNKWQLKNILRESQIIITQHAFYYIQLVPDEHSSYLQNFCTILTVTQEIASGFRKPPALPRLNLCYCIQEPHSWKSSDGLMDMAEEQIFNPLY